MKLYVSLKKEIDYSYPIFIGYKLLSDNSFVSFLEENFSKYSNLVLVVDKRVLELHYSYIESLLSRLKVKNLIIPINSGEKYKNRRTKEYIEDTMFKNRIDRKSLLMALGGGVIGDLAGFTAATYMRGIDFVQVPTTLLSCVDSSIGGKVGIDTPFGKNLLGAFYQPKMVVIDTYFLSTLPEREFLNGMAEVIKHSIISDINFFEFLDRHYSEILAKKASIEEIITMSCKIKKDVVEVDEKETGIRRVLNYGHTVGHAIEALSNYKILHGFAISVGMVVEAKISSIIGLLPESDVTRIINLLKKYNLPTTFENLRIKVDDKFITQMISKMGIDKKSQKGDIYMSLPISIGKMVPSGAIQIPIDAIIKAIKG